MKWKLVFTILWSVLILSHARADEGQEGHGGDGYFVDGKLYLVDLFEVGAHKNPYVESIAASSEMLEVAKSINLNDLNVAKALAEKLTEIQKKSSILGALLIASAKNYKFRFVPASLVNIKDSCSILTLDNTKVVQLAVRKGNIIYLAEDYWKKLEPSNKPALILHELLFPYQKSFPCSDSTRQVIGEFYNSSFAQTSNQDILRISYDMGYSDLTNGYFGELNDQFLYDGWSSLNKAKIVNINLPKYIETEFFGKDDESRRLLVLQSRDLVDVLNLKKYLINACEQIIKSSGVSKDRIMKIKIFDRGFSVIFDRHYIHIDTPENIRYSYFDMNGYGGTIPFNTYDECLNNSFKFTEKLLAGRIKI
ncbi:MAG: hypothetical protein QE271_00810 [Bacteriovoracaceae bacterium]|nr:hypothetical protein [Bacteriovoracaceae bacterium]